MLLSSLYWVKESKKLIRIVKFELLYFGSFYLANHCAVHPWRESILKTCLYCFNKEFSFSAFLLLSYVKIYFFVLLSLSEKRPWAGFELGTPTTELKTDLLDWYRLTTWWLLEWVQWKIEYNEYLCHQFLQYSILK